MSTGQIDWQPGQMARLAVVGGPRWVMVVSITGNQCTYLGEHGGVGYCGVSALLTKAGYLAHCDYMRDDWTGKEYREMREKAERQFVPPANWDECVKRATGAIN